MFFQWFRVFGDSNVEQVYLFVLKAKNSLLKTNECEIRCKDNDRNAAVGLILAAENKFAYFTYM